MTTAAVAIICKTPEAGKSKTRLSPPLTPAQCAELSACFIRDLAANLADLAADGRVVGHALYTPAGSEARLSRLLPTPFGLVLQSDGDLGARLDAGIRDLLALGHGAAIIVSSDSPTLPRASFAAAVDRLLAEDCVVLCPALDGGYTFIGLSRPHPELFADMPWSTADVHRLTVERARAIGLTVHEVPMWYDVDDRETLAVLRADLAGEPLPFACDGAARMPAPTTAAWLARLDDSATPAFAPAFVATPAERRVAR
ncbi:glycosyltransferase [Siculibacillus lacustris]|uniref:Glycosyltransferase n=1 Tax=Siculibacillus lacustris TaxID=1549641 RepID=A0A4Q9VF06_9HYPH|nr:TIGR04282 family arsenosugar biosynthesis glycosyltransferase [Siculibacillus lacustris]TBW33422.1 glycosyltransferase [Siculibacillus lacustris]